MGVMPEYDEEDYKLEYKRKADDELRPPIDPNMLKLQVEPDISNKQKDILDVNRPFYGRHAALGNSLRDDNLKFLDIQDVVNIFDRCPTLRGLANQWRGRALTEIQLMRSNPEIGGFERKMEGTLIKREAIDLKQAQMSTVPKSGMFSMFRRGKKE